MSDDCGTEIGSFISQVPVPARFSPTFPSPPCPPYKGAVVRGAPTGAVPECRTTKWQTLPGANGGRSCTPHAGSRLHTCARAPVYMVKRVRELCCPNTEARSLTRGNAHLLSVSHPRTPSTMPLVRKAGEAPVRRQRARPSQAKSPRFLD